MKWIKKGDVKILSLCSLLGGLPFLLVMTPR